MRAHTGFEWPGAGTAGTRTAAQAAEAEDWELSGCLKEEEFTRVEEALALFDYLRKSRSCMDSWFRSAGARIRRRFHASSRWRWKWPSRRLGEDGVRAKLGYIPNLPGEFTPRALTGALLTTAYQATENSGPVTRAAAAQISAAIGATHYELDVSELHRGYVQNVEAALGRKLDWRTDDLALQNIQERVRSPGVWMLANVRNALLLSTSNRSEAAVGYATMDGDSSGGLSPIAGIDKAFLRHWLRWLEKCGPATFQPIPALAAVNAQAPTAELRPSGARQTDEDDLMPYEVLDAIERAAIRDKRSPAEVFYLLQRDFPQCGASQLGLWIERFFRLWNRNQWKRERYAPSFHLDDENLDPKTWCRWPILSGGFEMELLELRKQMDSLKH